MSILKFLIAIMLILMIPIALHRFGVPLDLLSWIQDLLLFLSSRVPLIGLVVGAFAIIAFLNRIGSWIGTTETPNEPQKIVLFTKETPAQIVGAANEAKRKIILAFVLTVVVFVLVVKPFPLGSLPQFDLLRTIGLTRINPDPSTAAEPPVLSTFTPTPVITPALTPTLTSAPSLTPAQTVIVLPSATPELKPSAMMSQTVYIIIITTADP